MGANGKKPEFDDIFMHLATQLAQRSHCVRAKVGVVLTKDNRVISTGYNGPPSGEVHCDESGGCGENSCPLGMHAELNAVLFAAKNQILLEGATLYTTLSPCIDCARMILGLEIKRVVYKDSYAEYKKRPMDEGIDFLKRYSDKVRVEPYPSPNPEDGKA